MIRILLAEDQSMVRGALSLLISSHPELEVAAECSNGREALLQADLVRPDVCVLDIDMPEMDGIAATREILTHHPNASVLIVTTFGKAGLLERAQAAGATGFIVKDSPVNALVEAILRVHRGETVIDEELASTSAKVGSNPLSLQEARVLAMASEGKTVAAIAQILSLAPGTVRNYISASMNKLGATNRIEAAKTAMANGWL